MLQSHLFTLNYLLIYCFCMITSGVNLASALIANYLQIKEVKKSSNFSKSNFYNEKSKLNSNATIVSQLLNSLLKNYNKHLHPKFGSSKKTRVYIDMFVRTMGPISEMTDVCLFIIL